MKITVGVLDILLGERRNTHACMLARAVQRQALHLQDVHVGLGNIIAVCAGESVEITLPDSITDKIWKFDHHRLLLPFSFELTGLEVKLIGQSKLAVEPIAAPAAA